MSRGVRRNALVEASEGQEVKKGDLLFVIDPRPFQANLEQAQGQLASDTAQLGLHERNLEREEKICSFLFSGSPNQVFQ
jgi:multidrug efflux system membrane fusion protein